MKIVLEEVENGESCVEGIDEEFVACLEGNHERVVVAVMQRESEEPSFNWEEARDRQGSSM